MDGKQALGSLCVLSGSYPSVLNPHYNAGPDEGLLLSGFSVPVFSSANKLVNPEERKAQYDANGRSSDS